jgi:hypothetical protein
MERLVDSGAEIEPHFLDVAQGPLAEWLSAQAPAPTAREGL